MADASVRLGAGMKLGFVGTGTIATAMIDGLCAMHTDCALTVSPRNAEVAAGLAARHANVRVAGSNQAVLDASDVVVLAVRPQVAGELLPTLAFRADHHVISLIATLSLDYLRKVTTPARTLTRAVPLPPVARCQGPTAFFPPDPLAQALFDVLGTGIALDTEGDFDAFTTATATMASYFAFADTIAIWLERHGIASAKSRLYLGQMLQGLASAETTNGFAALADEHQTRGGLNEQVYRAMTTDGLIVDLDRALDGILARLQTGPKG